MGKNTIEKKLNLLDSYNLENFFRFTVRKFIINGLPISIQLLTILRIDIIKHSEFFFGASGVIIVFDITRKDTFMNIPKWILEIININNRDNLSFILVGNKSDLRGTYPKQVSVGEAKDYAHELSRWIGFPMPYIEISAKMDKNIDQIFLSLLKLILEKIYH